jgi:hypothetical protein
MFGALLIVAVIAAVGTRAADALRVQQQEAVLANLPEEEARAYYQVLRRRVRRVAILRVIALVSLVTIFYCYKARLAGQLPRMSGLGQLAVPVAVAEVDRQADHQPHPQP